MGMGAPTIDDYPRPKKSVLLCLVSVTSDRDDTQNGIAIRRCEGTQMMRNAVGCYRHHMELGQMTRVMLLLK